MKGAYKNSGGSLAYAKRIARTEGHRIQVQAGMDACYKAKEKGADVVKQWDATLDAKTRESHVEVDQEVKELDEKFSNGLMFPGDPSGGAAEVVNCRCALLQRARWAVKGGFTKMNNFTKELETFDSPESYDEFKKAFFSKENRNYMNYTQQMQEKYGTRDFQKLLEKMDDREYNHLMKLQKGNPLFNKNSLTNNVKSDRIPSNNNKAVRKQYLDDVSKIKEGIDPTLPIEEQARQAFEARNAARNRSRQLMTDKETLKKLEKEHPNKTFEELVEDKMKRKGMTREEAIQDVYDTSTKTNAYVNKELGLDGDD